MHEKGTEEIQKVNKYMGQMMRELQTKVNHWAQYFEEHMTTDPNLSFVLDDISSTIGHQAIETHVSGSRFSPLVKVGLISAKIWQGQRRRGVENGPDDMKRAGLLTSLRNMGVELRDFGDMIPKNIPDDTFGHIMHPRTVGEFCQRLSDRCQEVLRDNRVSLVLGGDHSLASGSLHGYASVYPDIRVIWIDAHSDLHLPTTTVSGNLHGCAMGLMVEEMNTPGKNPLPGWEWHKKRIPVKNLVYIGLRDVDPAELMFLQQYKIRYFTMQDIDEYGIKVVTQLALSYLAPMKDRPIAIQFDIDSFDPLHALTTGTAVDGGLTFREGLTMMEEIWKTKLVVAIDMCEVNVTLGSEKEGQRTVISANKAITVGLGEPRQGVIPPGFVPPKVALPKK